ncbi:U-actitoxin-Avd3n [Liparis tanakae]|uniref:U-actitoxin-Avd3n n=1 Tax=Liparis tanakae TaxID=230148 RepID=A0A4Z2JAW3_9TELE|nr:U-actitoxin-Avd3n [Liparis tanakae]
MDASLACRFKHAVGECSGKFLRYYYDSVHDKCKKFLWSGCIGNGNRFNEQGSCNATCAGIHAIICGVLLSVIIAAIFITVIVLTVQSKKKSPKTKAERKSNEPKPSSPLQDTGIEME